MSIKTLLTKQRQVSFRRDVRAIRERALGNMTLMYQYKQFFKGLSFTMVRTYRRIEALQAVIIVSNRRSCFPYAISLARWRVLNHCPT